MATYPGGIYNAAAVVNGVTKLVAALFNTPNSELTAVETELGADVAGSAADLVTRLAVFLEADGHTTVDLSDYGTTTGSPTARTFDTVKLAAGITPGDIAQTGTHIVTGLPFASTTSYYVMVTPENDGEDTICYGIVQDSASQFTITNNSATAMKFRWFAIGT